MWFWWTWVLSNTYREDKRVEGEIQKIADLVYSPFTNQSVHDIREFLDNSQKKNYKNYVRIKRKYSGKRR